MQYSTLELQSVVEWYKKLCVVPRGAFFISWTMDNFIIKFNTRPHHNQRWGCKVDSSMQLFYKDIKIASFNALDFDLGIDYIKHKLIREFMYAKYGRTLPTGIVLRRVLPYEFPQPKYTTVCKLIRINKFKTLEKFGKIPKPKINYLSKMF